MSRFHIIQPVVENQKNRSLGAEVVVEGESLEVLDRDAAVAVHDGLGQARRARREQDVERRGERQAYELQRAGLGGELGPGDRAIGRGRRRVEVGQPHDGAHARQAAGDRLDLGATVDALGPVAGIRRRRARPSARSAATGRRRSACRTPERTTRTRRRGSRRPAAARGSRGCWGRRPRPGRRARPRRAPGRRGRGRPGRAARGLSGVRRRGSAMRPPRRCRRRHGRAYAAWPRHS